MTKILLITILVAAIIIAALVVFCMAQHAKIKQNKELYQEAEARAVQLSATVGKLQAAQIITNEERKNAEEKISAVHNGTNRDRFNRINDGLRNKSKN